MKYFNIRTNCKLIFAMLVLAVGVLTVVSGVLPISFQNFVLAGINSPTTKVKEKLPLATRPVVFNAELATDRRDYRPGDIVQITGSGFTPNQLVTLLVVHIAPQSLSEGSRSMEFADHSGHTPWTVMVGDDGNFISSWLVQEDSLDQTLLLTADQPGVHAEVVFTDASIGTYDQCSNDDGDGYPGPPPGNADEGCHWINGNLNANNSTYHEGDSTVQRLWVDDITPGSTHTVTFQYGTTKGGKHAYDYLTTWDHSENWISLADRCQDIPGCTTAAETTFGIPNDPNVTDTIELPPGGPLTRLFTARGATITAVSVPTLASGSYAADGETNITVTVQLAPSGPMCDAGGCGVAIWFGAHIARTDQWTPFNGTTGATAIPGSPYHVALDQLDGASIGQRDNQMQANAVVPPTGVLTISKTTLGGVSGPFNFTASPATAPIPANFALTTTALSNPTSISWTAVSPGVYRITESSLPAGWSFVDIDCNGDLDGGNVINLAGRYVDVDMDNGEGQNCTFRNTKPEARIVLSPLTATNEVGQNHVITATVSQDDHIPIGGTGGDAFDGFGPAPNGTTVNFSLLNNVAGATFVGANSCVTAGGNGQCSVTITSLTNAGGVDIHATTTFTVYGVSLTRATGDSLSGDSVDAHKDFVNMSIAITPDTDTNGVGDPHVFTVTVTKFPAGVPAAGGTVAITTSLNPAPSVSTPNTCGPAVAFVGNVATCTVTINNNTAGTFTLNASATATLGNPGIVVTRDTDPATASIGSGPGGSGPGVKNYVDMSVAIAASATNPVGQPHEFTVTVTKYPSTASGATVNVTTSVNPAPTFGATTCNVPLVFNGAGVATCTFSINSNVAGVFVANASASATVGGVALVRDTDPSTPATSGPGGSGPATKTYVAAGLTIVKRVVNDNGGTATAASFGITSTAGGVVFGAPVENPAGTFTYTATAFTNLAPATYTLHENDVAGYTEGSWSCNGAGAVNSDFNTGSVALLANENVTCTIINNDIAPQLHLRKVVVNDNGGTATVADFTLTANGAGANDISGTSPVDSGAGLLADTFALSESLSAAATGKYTASAWVCVGGTQNGSNITVGLAESATCTITNDDIAPALHLRKVVVNDNGGTATVADFTLTANGAGANDISGTSPVDSGAGLLADTFALSESLSAAATGKYSASAWVCVGGTQNGSNITVGLAESATCTITNDDIAPALHLRKVVVNDNGGTATVADFTLTANGAGANDISGTSPVDSGAGLLADTFALSESLSAAATGKYTASAWVCVGGTQNGSNITVGLAESATCTITNDDIAPALHLRKVVVNDNGGTATVADFTLTANGAGANDISGTSPVDSGAGLLADTFALSESLSAAATGKYSASAWVCVGGTQNGSNITVGLAESATCTITNDDIAPALHLRKVVVNDNGGTATVADFTLTANGAGANDISGTSPVDSGAGLLADTFALSESLSAAATGKYSASAWVCVGGTQNGSNITVGLAESATCTITNDDIAPQLTLFKRVINDNGGTAGVGSFGLLTNAGPLSFDTGNPDGPFTTKFLAVTLTGLSAGNKTLVEGTFAGYSNGSWGCINSDLTPHPVISSTFNAGLVALGLGENVICGITNDDIAPTLRVIKLLVPTNDPGLFNLQIDGSTAGTGANVGHNGTTGFVPVNAGVPHLVGETAGTGTSLSDYGPPLIGGDCLPSGLIVLSVGDAPKTCTITNRRLPTLILRKVISGSSTQFDFTVDGNPTDPPNPNISVTPPNDGEASSPAQVIQPGDYTATEINIPAGWLLSDGSCVSDQPTGFVTNNLGLPNLTFTARYGDDVICTFVDNQQGGATRTQGFWATHTVLTNTFWNGGTLPPGTSGQLAAWVPVIDSEDAYLCKPPTIIPPFAGVKITAIPATGQNQVMGGFWANIAKTLGPPSAKRSDLDKVRMQFLQQYLAAVLNVHAFGTPISGTTLANARTVYCGNNSSAILTQMGLLAAYNESGDNGEFTPGANATAQLSRSQANIGFWDITLR